MYPLDLGVEGGQAVDINLDGYIDLYTESHLFLNYGGSGLEDVNLGIPATLDEGAKFADFNNDGWLDLTLQIPGVGLGILYGPATGFNAPIWLSSNSVGNGEEKSENEGEFGLKIYDVDGNGYEDIVTKYHRWDRHLLQ